MILKIILYIFLTLPFILLGLAMWLTYNLNEDHFPDITKMDSIGVMWEPDNLNEDQLVGMLIKALLIASGISIALPFLITFKFIEI